MSEAASITVRVALSIRRPPGRKAIGTPVSPKSARSVPTPADPALVKSLAREFRYQRLTHEGPYATISEMPPAEQIESGYLGSPLRLTPLAPDIDEATLNGPNSAGITPPRLS